MTTTSVSNQPSSSHPSRSEWRIGWLLMGILFLVRLAYVFRYRIDSDEPQHLHVVWNWAQGLVAYRDFFDNHTPLFHLLFSPLLNWIGPQPVALNLMRLFMIPLNAVGLWAVYRIGCCLFSKRIAFWGALFAGAFPNHFFPAVEFRTDNLWAPVWLLAVMVLVTGRASKARWAGAGLLVGAGFAISMKTSLLLATLGGAGLMALPICPLLRPSAGRSAGRVLSLLLGALVVPAALAAFLYYQGAFYQFLYCVIDHNILPAQLAPHRSRLGALWLSGVVPAFWFAARWIFQNAPDQLTGTRRVVVFLQSFLLIAVLELVWPEVTRQDYLPAYPLAALLATPLLLAAAQWVAKRFAGQNPHPVAAGVSIFSTLILWIFLARPLSFDGTRCEVRFLSDVLRLTEPGEFVMTFKGEAVFRPRPFFYVLEPFTRIRLNKGLLKDDIAGRLMATKTCVAMTRTRRMPKEGEAFVQENYIPVGQLRVAGKVLGKAAAGGSIQFEVKIPAVYTLISGTAAYEGLLDGTQFNAPRLLEAGTHEIRPGNPSGEVTLIWNRAIERGFRPSPAGFIPERIGSEF